MEKKEENKCNGCWAEQIDGNGQIEVKMAACLSCQRFKGEMRKTDQYLTKLQKWGY
jgi:hypothetical protein